MGNIFSKDTTTEDTAYDNYLKQIQEAQKVSTNLVEQAVALEQKQKELKEASLKRQREVVLRRKQEAEEEIKRIEEIKDARKKLNIYTARLITGVCFNYYFGICDDDEFETNASNFTKTYLNEDVFWLMCKIPLFVPLLWPTGDSANDDAAHDYDKLRDKTTGNIKLDEYHILMNDVIPKYVKETLPTVLMNVYKHNLLRDYNVDNDVRTTLENSCQSFIDSVEELKTDEEFVKAALKWLQGTSMYTDKYQWRLLRAKGKKGISSKTIMVLPANYPLYDHKYEIREALMMLVNTCCYRYGQCLNEQRLKAKTKDEILIDGGRCFNINTDAATKAYESSLKLRDDYINTELWDGKTYVDIKSLVVSNGEEPITYTTCTDLVELYTDVTTGAMSDDKYIKHNNPTKKYTQVLLDDIDGVAIGSHLSSINCDNVNGIIDVLFELLTSQGNEYYNVYSASFNPNFYICSCFDYITVRPKALEGLTGEDESYVSPLCEFVYNQLIKMSSVWNITIPLNNIVSCAQVNSHISNIDKAYSPLYMFTRSSLVNENYGSASKATLTDASYNFTSIDMCSKGNVITIQDTY